MYNNIIFIFYLFLCIIHHFLGGTPLEYKFLNFSSNGAYLAAFSGVPDYALAIWNWTAEKTLCKHEVIVEK